MTIDTMEPDRDFIVINKQKYDLRADVELSLEQMKRLRKMSKEMMDRGFGGDDATDEDIARIENYADESLNIMVVDLPREVRDRLPVMWKFKIVQAFTTVASSKRAGTVTEKNEGSQPTTGGLSQGSVASTEGPSTII